MKKLLALLCIGLGMSANAQELDVSAELRPRFEYRHGFKTLIPDTMEAASFVSQRSRINFGYKSEKLIAKFSLQNLRIWGDVSTQSLSDKNGTSIHEAWAEVILNPQIALKLGRQEISYDNERILGRADWSLPARRHDALVVKYTPNANHRLDFGLAMNEENADIFKTDYTVNNSKAFQYLWYHTNVEAFGLSFLVFNNGLAYDDNGTQEVAYNQTLGTHATYQEGRFNADASAYYQTGKIAKSDLNAYNFALNAKYDLTEDFNLGLGVEYFSGTDMDTSSNKLESFTPWFGTNHRYNGWMDYFYAGNHSNSVGLLDINAALTYQKNKFSAKLMPHFFSSTANIVNTQNEEMSNGLGTEIDAVLSYAFTKDIQFHAGYSQMFATESMEVLKGGNRNATNNWGWAMVVIKPSLFKTSFKKE